VGCCRCGKLQPQATAAVGAAIDMGDRSCRKQHLAAAVVGSWGRGQLRTPEAARDLLDA